MTAPAKAVPYPSPSGILTIGTALFFFLLNGALALTMRA
jgi:hypothetical protein